MARAMTMRANGTCRDDTGHFFLPLLHVSADTFQLITSVVTIGTDTVRVKLKQPSGQIEYRLAYNSGMLMSPAAFAPLPNGDAPFGSSVKPIGAGPYQVKAFDPNTKTVMTRFDKYWGGVKDRPAGFENHYVPDSRARFNALRSGQATIALIEPRQIPEAKSPRRNPWA